MRFLELVASSLKTLFQYCLYPVRSSRLLYVFSNLDSIAYRTDSKMLENLSKTDINCAFSKYMRNHT